jgi:hypothetical protein
VSLRHPKPPGPCGLLVLRTEFWVSLAEGLGVKPAALAPVPAHDLQPLNKGDVASPLGSLTLASNSAPSWARRSHCPLICRSRVTARKRARVACDSEAWPGPLKLVPVCLKPRAGGFSLGVVAVFMCWYGKLAITWVNPCPAARQPLASPTPTIVKPLQVRRPFSMSGGNSSVYALAASLRQRCGGSLPKEPFLAESGEPLERGLHREKFILSLSVRTAGNLRQAR